MRIRTGYSFRTAVGHLDDVMSRLKECNYPVAPISDRCSTFGFARWTKLCKKENIKPLYGVELAVVIEMGVKKPVIDYWTFFAIDSLKPLHELIASATDNPDREPSLTYDEALSSKGLVKIAGERLQIEHVSVDPIPENFFVALSPATPKGLYRKVKATGLPFVECSDNRYTRVNDKEFYRIVVSRPGRTADVQTYPQHILTTEEWEEQIKWIATEDDMMNASNNAQWIAEICNATMRHGQVLVPEKPLTLREMCIQGAKRTGINLDDHVYSARLERELQLIAEKKFEDYFYIIADMINWAKERMIVGPARGSSCGSLVCYLLNITAIDPIPFGLMFERFIDINRMDLPDIDIDFSDEKRYMVFEYAAEKYGQDHVARLGTVMIYRARSALNQIAIALRIPRFMINKVSESIIERSQGDSRVMSTLEDTLKETEMGLRLTKEFPESSVGYKMEGHPNGPGQHAAGIVITQEPVIEFVAVDRRTNSVMCDKKDAEDLDLLKIDALGLTQLSIFERTLELIGQPNISGWLEKLPLDDPLAFAVLNRGHFAGIFQFNGMALQSLTKQVKVESIEDIITITALGRPGPISTGGATSWVHRRTGKEKVTQVHPILAEATSDSYGVVVYQEQVMKILRGVGLMSWEDTGTLRKAMSRSMGNEYFEAYWEKFKIGAVSQGFQEKEARAIWDQVNKFGSWAFNKAHAVAYGLVSYWCCWLKAYYPLEFAAATLDTEALPLNQIHILRELQEEGISYVPIDIENSTERWVPTEVGENRQRMLVGPLTQIHGIGPAFVREILTCRKDGKPIREALMKKLINPKTAIDSLYPIQTALKNKIDGKVQTKPTPIKQVQIGLQGEVVVIGVLTKIAPKDENEAQNVAKRGGKVFSGPTQALNLFIMDDTDEIFAKVDRFSYDWLGVPIVETGKPGKAIWALKGTVPRGFRMLSVNRARYIGDL